MTERLYYTSDATECPARVVNCLGEADGRYAIELDRTLFHPQGGDSRRIAAGLASLQSRALPRAARASCILLRSRYPPARWRSGWTRTRDGCTPGYIPPGT